jgi:hypothetical protein
MAAASGEVKTRAGWAPIEGSVPEVLARVPRPFEALASGEIPALVLRRAFPEEQCRAVVRRLYERGGILERPGLTYDAVGTSLVNLGADPEVFFAHARQTHALYAHLFAGLQHPVDFVYRSLAALAPDRHVRVAWQPDGRLYGPAIFRIYRAGKGHHPHYDSVRLREGWSHYAAARFRYQFASILCLQATEPDPESGECILYRQFWSPELQPLCQDGSFYHYADEQQIERARIELVAGDFYVFNPLNIHAVPPIHGETPRIVLATFLGFSPEDEEVFVWS